MHWVQSFCKLEKKSVFGTMMECSYHKCDHQSYTNDCNFINFPTNDCAARIWKKYANVSNDDLKKVNEPSLCSCHFDGTSDYPIPHYILTKTRIDSLTNSSADPITIVKSEPFDHDLCDTNESSVYCVTECESSSSSQLLGCKTEDATSTRQMYKCEQCGHMNMISQSSEDGYFDNSQSVVNSSSTSSTFHVSIDPESLQLRNQALPLQSNKSSCNDQNDGGTEVYNAKKKKRLVFPGDVGDGEQLGDETAQKYISVLRKTVMDQRRQTKTLMQQNRRKQQRINKLKTLLKDLVEKTKNGNYMIEATS